MQPNDKRHGTYAGFVAHRHHGVPYCEPCRTVGLKRQKLYRVERHARGGGVMVALGESAWQVLNHCIIDDLAAKTGMHERRLRQIATDGPDCRVYPSTRDSILNARPVTHQGIVRRIQALSAIGWSARALSARCGIWPDNLVQLRLGRRNAYLRYSTVTAIVGLYEDLAYQPPEPSRHVTATRKLAASRGWAPPLAWDDIDHDRAPKGIRLDRETDGDIDPIVVERILQGDYRITSTNAERAEVVRRWYEAGRSRNELARLAGWKPERYYRREVAA